ncbi:MAG: nucleotide-binding protein [Agriterribacter sp.]
MERKSVFICSASSALDIALCFKKKLSDEHDVFIWKEGAFGLTEHYLESIAKASQRYEFAVILLTPEIKTAIADGFKIFAKDNVIFEMGYFLGTFGRSRTFFVVEKSEDFKLPSYIDGINCAEFVRPSSIDLLDIELISACNAVKTVLQAPKSNDVWVDSLVDSALSTACRALAVPFTADEAKIRAFIFKKQTSKLICTHFWAPFNVSEVIGISFDINQETEKQVAVVMAAQRKKVCALSVSVLPDTLDGVNGNIDRDLSYILAAPISGPKGETWGTIDFDASNERGENLLRTAVAKQVIFQLGKHLYGILEGT